MGFRILILLVPCLAYPDFSGKKKFDVLHKWKELDFDFPSSSARDRFIRNGEFIPGNPVPIDVDTWQHDLEISEIVVNSYNDRYLINYTDNDERIFMTIPRFKDGIPASLVTVSNKKGANDQALLQPYPDWSWHVYEDCDGVTSAFRTQIDQCGRLWVIDSGMVDLFKSPRRRLCQPQLLAFTLASDKLAKRYRFPNSVLDQGSILTTVAVDVRDSRNQCSDTFAYVADVTGDALIVYDAKNDKSWKVQSNTMYAYPPQGVFQTNGVEFDLMDGVIGLALGPVQNGKRTLYYHSFASIRESWVSTSVLKNESVYSTGFNTAPREFKMSEEARPSQSAAQAFDKQGVLYFAPVAQNAIYCWNSQNSYKSQNLHELVRDDENLQFATGLKVIQPDNRDEEIWMITTRFHLVMVGQMKSDEVNFRIIKAKLSDLTRGTPCQQSRPIAFPQTTHGYGHSYHHHRDKNRRPGYGKF